MRIANSLGPGASTGTVDLWSIAPGLHEITVQAEGVVSGCNTGALYSWAGTLTLSTETCDAD